jgi:hypothetical protein
VQSRCAKQGEWRSGDDRADGGEFRRIWRRSASQARAVRRTVTILSGYRFEEVGCWKWVDGVGFRVR